MLDQHGNLLKWPGNQSRLITRYISVLANDHLRILRDLPSGWFLWKIIF